MHAQFMLKPSDGTCICTFNQQKLGIMLIHVHLYIVCVVSVQYDGENSLLMKTISAVPILIEWSRVHYTCTCILSQDCMVCCDKSDMHIVYTGLDTVQLSSLWQHASINPNLASLLFIHT